jgi:hypothetical protein
MRGTPRKSAAAARMFLAISALVVSSDPLLAQVFAITGGASSLYQSQGGAISFRQANMDASIGAGITASRFVAGGHIIRTTPKATYTLGQQILQFNFPTDIFDADHYLDGIGATVRRRFGRADVTAFGGALAQTLDGPYFSGSRVQQAAGALLINLPLAKHLFSATELIASNRSTAIEGIGWTLTRHISLGAAGGIGANAPYAAVSLAEHNPWLDVDAAYVEASSRFARAPAGMPLTAEPIRDNLLVTLRPSSTVTVSGGRQNFLTRITTDGGSVNNSSSASGTLAFRSTVNNIAANVVLDGAHLSTTLFQSSYAGHSDLAAAYSASRDLTARIHLQASYLQSRADHANTINAFNGNIQETLSPRLTVSEQISSSGGQQTVGLGGMFLSNFATFNASYQTYYVPADTTAPFQNALLLDLQLHLFRRLSVHLSNYVGANGHILYSADARAEASRLPADTSSHTSFGRNMIGDMVVFGTVVSPEGMPIDGAALLLDQTPLFTDSTGRFFLREAKARTHTLTVLTDSFQDGYNYRIVSAPASVRSIPEKAQQREKTELIIIVQKIAQKTAQNIAPPTAQKQPTQAGK